MKKKEAFGKKWQGLPLLWQGVPFLWQGLPLFLRRRAKITESLGRNETMKLFFSYLRTENNTNNPKR